MSIFEEKIMERRFKEEGEAESFPPGEKDADADEWDGIWLL